MSGPARTARADGCRRRAWAAFACAAAAILAVVAATPEAAAGEWLPGDTHSHISPPDVPPAYTHAKNDLEGAIASAREGGLRWLIITPHAMDRRDEKSGRLWAVEMGDRLARREARAGDPLVVLGWECTLGWPGHLVVSFVELERVVNLSASKLLEEVRRQGGLAIVAHPFQLPSALVSGNRSWRPWTAGPQGAEFDAWLAGLEVRHPASPAVTAAEHWDEWIGRERRRIVGVGATDDHWGTLYPTTWAYVEGELTREKLHGALRAGRVTVGSDASAGSLRVASDRKDGEGNAESGGPGDNVAADGEVRITWQGTNGRLYVDGKLRENARSPVTCKFDKGTFHWVRLEMGIKSYSNPVYINLPAERAPAPLEADAKRPQESRDDEAERSRPRKD